MRLLMPHQRLGPAIPWLRPVVGCTFALLAVLLATMSSFALRQHLHFEVLIGIFLAAIMGVATTAGSGPAILSAVLGWTIYNYFLEEPRYVLQLRSLQDVVTAALFISVAAVLGVQSDRVRAAARRAEVHADQLDELLQASRAFSEPTVLGELYAVVCAKIGEVCHGEVWLFDEDGVLLAKTTDEATSPPDFIRQSGRTAPAGHTAVASGWCARALETGGARLGSLVWQVAPRRQAESQSDLVQVALMSDLAAAAVLRLRDREVRSEAEALLRTESLRTALLSSISHDFRTPLSGVMASATALIDYGTRFDHDTRRELLDNIVREGHRLNRFVAKVLDMTRIGSGAIQPQVEALLLSELIERSLEEARRLTPEVVFEPPSGAAPMVLGDPVLLETALMNVLENAARYSPNGGRVVLTLQVEAEAVLICISDEGPGVLDSQRDIIFEAFRSLEPERQRSGLGLSIVRAFVEACGGLAWATAREDGRSGLCVWIRLQRGLERR